MKQSGLESDCGSKRYNQALKTQTMRDSQLHTPDSQCSHTIYTLHSHKHTQHTP